MKKKRKRTRVSWADGGTSAIGTYGTLQYAVGDCQANEPLPATMRGFSVEVRMLVGNALFLFKESPSALPGRGFYQFAKRLKLALPNYLPRLAKLHTTPVEFGGQAHQCWNQAVIVTCCQLRDHIDRALQKHWAYLGDVDEDTYFGAVGEGIAKHWKIVRDQLQQFPFTDGDLHNLYQKAVWETDRLQYGQGNEPIETPPTTRQPSKRGRKPLDGKQEAEHQRIMAEVRLNEQYGKTRTEAQVADDLGISVEILKRTKNREQKRRKRSLN